MPLTLEEELAFQVSSEYAKLKQSGARYINYSQLLMNAITGHGQYPPDEIARLKSDVAVILAQGRRARATRQHHRY
jgi:hypothetical protein